MITLRILSGDEDTWLCEDGQWVKHGNPSSAEPTSGCNKDVASTNDVNKSCTNNNDCGLDMCTGCFNKDYLETQESNLPCRTYADMTCVCENNVCTSSLAKNDMWICDGKEWIKQGNPTDPKPTETCTAENSAFPKDNNSFEYHWSEMKEGPYHDKVTYATGTDLTNWTPTSTILADHASVPAGVIKDGVIYVYFVDVTTEGLPEQLGMVKSEDQGKTWSQQKTITIEGIGDRATADPDPVLLADGRIRLFYFDINEARINAGETQEPPAKIYSAISDDGINFTQEDGVRFQRATGIYDPDVELFGGTWYLYGGVEDGQSVIYATSDDGLTFTETGVAYSGGGVPDVYYENGTYYLFTAGIDIATGTTPTSFTRTGTHFQDQDSEGATADPSVIKLDDGSYLLLYKIQ